jgi:hypothetical protein
VSAKFPHLNRSLKLYFKSIIASCMLCHQGEAAEQRTLQRGGLLVTERQREAAVSKLERY